MTLSTLPLGYCTNVHPARSLKDVDDGLDRYAVPIQKRLARPMAVGLWLAAPLIDEVKSNPSALEALRDGLARRGLVCYTLNAFPYGDFHSDRVKENVYLPDWSSTQRCDYTRECGRALAALLPEGVEGSISTLPLGFKSAAVSLDFEERCCDHLVDVAREFARIREETGRVIRLAIEPEPFCRIETTAETVEFFGRLWRHAAAVEAEPLVREHVGVCYDVCHQAVEFEDAGEAVRTLHAAGIAIPKVQISCAIEVRNPLRHPERLAALSKYVEPRYLHQTMARGVDGVVHRAVDLTPALTTMPPPAFAAAELWRVHFHVPVDAEQIGPLHTTRDELKSALRAIAALPDAPHLEVETYTWEVLPGQTADLVEGMCREIVATNALIESLGTKG